MYQTFFLCFFTTCLPVFLIFIQKRWRRHFFFALPPALLFSQGLLGLVTSLLAKKMSFGICLYALSVLGDFLFLQLIFRVLEKSWIKKQDKVFSGRKMFLFAGLAFLTVLDGFVIYSKVGWHNESGLQPYIRAPFNADVERNVDIVTAVLRGGESPFLPGSKLTYQTVWNNFAALSIFPFQLTDPFALVSGCTLVTAFLFFFTLFWALFLMRPTVFRNPRTVFLWFLIIGCHTDIYNLICNLLVHGKPGIESDWSIQVPVLFRFVSFKALSLIAPQHLCSLGFSLLFLSAARWLKPGGIRMLVEGLLFFNGFLVSPILTLEIFAFFWVIRLVKKIWHGNIKLGDLIIPPLFFALSLAVSPGGLLSTSRSEGILILSFIPGLWKVAPYMFLGMFGFVGFILSGLMFTCFFKRKISETSFYSLIFLVFGGITSTYLFSNPEIRRHFAIAALLVAVLFVARELHHYKNRSQRWIALAAVIILLNHGYFVYSYTGKPSSLSSKIPWTDYLEMNRTISDLYPHAKVMAASHTAFGTELPLAMQVATSFGEGPLWIPIHTKITEEQRKLLVEGIQSGSFLSVASRLGYDSFIWGPIEERAWGTAVNFKFIKQSRLLTKTGQVGLYSILPVDNKLALRLIVKPSN